MQRSREVHSFEIVAVKIRLADDNIFEWHRIKDAYMLKKKIQWYGDEKKDILSQMRKKKPTIRHQVNSAFLLLFTGKEIVSDRTTSKEFNF